MGKQCVVSVSSRARAEKRAREIVADLAGDKAAVSLVLELVKLLGERRKSTIAD